MSKLKVEIFCHFLEQQLDKGPAGVNSKEHIANSRNQPQGFYRERSGDVSTKQQQQVEEFWQSLREPNERELTKHFTSS